MQDDRTPAGGGPFGEDDDISVLWISSRAYHALGRAELCRISDLLRMTDSQILATPGIGASGLADIRQAIERFVSDELEALMRGLVAAPDVAAPDPVSTHPMTIAKVALLEAAALEEDELWAHTIRRFADALPHREW
jgi:Bacterial RNA polymerase, alpha chain C terminal domain